MVPIGGAENAGNTAIKQLKPYSSPGSPEVMGQLSGDFLG